MMAAIFKNWVSQVLLVALGIPAKLTETLEVEKSDYKPC